MEFKIPESFNVGGVTVNINHVERCENNALGNCLLAASRIEIADLCNKDTKQSESNKLNTFFHELTHSILDTMGENELSTNEKFVSTFSAFFNRSYYNCKISYVTIKR